MRYWYGAVWLLLFLPLTLMAVEDAGDIEASVNDEAAEEAAKEEPPPVDERVRERLDELELNYKLKDKNNFSLIFTFDDERSQQVWVRSQTYSHHGAEMRDIWSYAYEHRTKYMPGHLERRLLLNNHELVLGMWARVGNDIIYLVKLPADASAELLHAALLDAAEEADALEERLLGTDDF